MNRPNSKKTTSRIKWLGIYQMLGGVIGTLFIVWGILNSQQMSWLFIAVWLLMTTFFAFSIFCGVLCVKTSNHALRLSLINQILQVIGFAMFGYAFKYVAGVHLDLGIDLTESFNLTYGAGVSTFSFNFNNEVEKLVIDFNFVALIFIIFIEGLKKRIKEEQNKNLISSLAKT